MHYPEKRRCWNITGEAGNRSCFYVDDHGIAKGFCHKSNLFTVWRNIGPFSKMGEHFNMFWQVGQRISLHPFSKLAAAVFYNIIRLRKCYTMAHKKEHAGN